jgi:hypothetical protein
MFRVRRSPEYKTFNPPLGGQGGKTLDTLDTLGTLNFFYYFSLFNFKIIRSYDNFKTD